MNLNSHNGNYMENISASYCSAFFLALANPLRIKILQQLVINPMNVSTLAQRVNGERTLVSHNLALLKKVDLVKSEKEGKKTIYKANKYIVPQVFIFLEGIVCSNCSIKKTCKTLKRVSNIKMPMLNRSICISCT